MRKTTVYYYMKHRTDDGWTIDHDEFVDCTVNFDNAGDLVISNEDGSLAKAYNQEYWQDVSTVVIE